MKVVVLGAGAMGTLFGTTLLKAGHDVIFLDSWQPLIYAISKDPYATLKLEGDVERIPVKLHFFSEPPEFEPDLVIVSVKSQATRSAVEAITAKKLIKENTIVFTCQGGFENSDVIASLIPNPQNLLYGCTKSFCKGSGPMTIEKFGIGNTSVWSYGLQAGQEPSERVKEIVESCNKAGLLITITEQAIAERWKMLLGYPTINALSAVCGLTFGDVWNTDEGKQLLTSLVSEVCLFAKAEGINEELFNEEIAMAHIKTLVVEGKDSPGTMLLDVNAHRITEADATSGAMLRKAENHGINLPTIRTVYSILRIKEQNYGSEYESK
jgi:2-dehydropantoate 2-reductase